MGTTSRRSIPGSGRPSRIRSGKGREAPTDVGDPLRIGAARVRFGRARSGNPKSNTPVVLAQVGELGILSPAPPLRSSLSPGERAFAEAINSKLAKSVNKDVSIYVHGFRVDFEEATRLLGSFHH